MTSATMTPFTFKRSRPVVVEPTQIKDLHSLSPNERRNAAMVLVEFSNFWMETEAVETATDSATSNTSTPHNTVYVNTATTITTTTDQPMAMDDSVSVISVESSEGYNSQPRDYQSETDQERPAEYKYSFMDTCKDIDSFMDNVVPHENQTNNMIIA